MELTAFEDFVDSSMRGRWIHWWHWWTCCGLWSRGLDGVCLGQLLARCYIVADSSHFLITSLCFDILNLFLDWCLLAITPDYLHRPLPSQIQQHIPRLHACNCRPSSQYSLSKPVSPSSSFSLSTTSSSLLTHCPSSYSSSSSLYSSMQSVLASSLPSSVPSIHIDWPD